MAKAAALYVDAKGVYPRLLGPEYCWDEARDARTYAGPWPVICHPPCGPWGRLRHLYKGNEHDCAPRAVEQVRCFGGVLEHPAHSRLWDEPLGLPRPPRVGTFSWVDGYGGFTIEICQCDWGHPARKRTWLYIVGAPRDLRFPPSREPTHWTSGGRTNSSRKGLPVPPGIKVCSAQQRRRTPVAFAEWLISIARNARRVGCLT